MFILFSSLAEIALLGIVVYLYLRSRRLRTERDMLAQEKEVIFGFIHDAGEVFADVENLELDVILNRILFYALRTTHAGAGAIYMRQRHSNLYRARAVSGLFPPLCDVPEDGLEQCLSKSQQIELLVRSQQVRNGEGLVGEVADLNTPILIDDPERDPRVPDYQAEYLKIHSILLVPMRFHHQILGVLTVVNRTDGRPFIQTDLNLLQALADQASVSIHFATLRESLNEKQRLDHDLDLAREIQISLLPKEIPRVEGFELAAYGQPALEVGGDYYDVLQVDDDHIGVAIADVSGKGISGAIMMSMCRSFLRAVARERHSPSDVLREITRLISRDISEDMFITMLYMIINTKTRDLVVARAGHERPILAPGNGDPITLIDSPGIAMGIGSEETFGAILRDTRVQLQPGDLVVAYTDGVTEAMNENNEEWGLDHFLEAIQVASSEGAHSVLNNVQQRVQRFAGNRAQYDDMTLLAIRVL